MGIEGDFIEVQQELARMPSQPHLIFAMAVCLVLVFGQGVRAELDDKVESSSLLPTKTIKGHTMDKVAKSTEEAVSNANAHVPAASHAGPSRQRAPETKLHNKDSTETGNTVGSQYTFANSHPSIGAVG